MRLVMKRICVPTDFSPAADHAVHFGAALARAYDATLHLLHVVEHADSLLHHPDFTGSGEVTREYFGRLEKAVEVAEEKIESDDHDGPHELSELIKSLESDAVEKIDAVGSAWWAGLDVHRDIRKGHPVSAINHYVESMGIDLVVMGTHGHSKLAMVLLGSVTERVVRTCSCPVTVVRHPEHKYELVE